MLQRIWFALWSAVRTTFRRPLPHPWLRARQQRYAGKPRKQPW